MLKALLKKQFAEIFRGYFYNQKTGKKRSVFGVIMMFLLFAFLMVGCIGGMFAGLAMILCPDLVENNYGWLYFLIFSMTSLVLGVFGSVFSSYTTLYLAKDNDLLLSMPIPASAIMASRLLSVYFLGLLYSGFAILPACVVYLIFAFRWRAVLGCFVLIVLISLIVFILSCLLGWVVAKISLRLKGKSFVAVLASLILIGGYYFVYFKAQGWIEALLNNPSKYADKVYSGAWVLYFFGTVGQGNLKAMAACGGAVLVLLVLVFKVMEKSFFRIATASMNTPAKKSVAKAEKAGSAFSALFKKELRRFASSANYMLNCGLGIVLLPAMGVLLLLKKQDVANLLTELGEMSFILPVAVCMISCLLLSMVDVAVPSVSLEGKNLWVLQSMPVNMKDVLGAKLMVQLFMSVLPGAVLLTCASAVFGFSEMEIVAIYLCFSVYALFFGLLQMSFGLLFANVNWTNEIVAIKQSLGILFILLLGWIVPFGAGIAYLFLGAFLSAWVYLLLVAALFGIWSFLVGLYVFRGGPKKMMAL